MEKIKINPQKARVKGNVMPDVQDLKNTDYEDYHVTHQLLQKTKYNNVEKQVIRLTPKGDPLTLTVTSDVTTVHPGDNVTLTCKATYNEEGVTKNLEGHTIYVYDNNVLLDTKITNSDGEITLTYSTSKEGEHTLSFRTLYSNGYDPATKNIKIIVYTSTKLTINPTEKSIMHDEILKISGKLTTNTGIALSNKEIILYEGGKRIVEKIRTNSKGEYSINYVESKNRGTPTKITVSTNPVVLIENSTNTIVGYLKTQSGTALANQEVRLYMQNSAYYVATTTTDNTGKFTLEYTPNNHTEYEYYIVYPAKVNNTTTNEYSTYEPCIYELGKIKPLKSPILYINAHSVINTLPDFEKDIMIQVRDDDNTSYSFENERCTIQLSHNNMIWVDDETLTLDAEGKAVYTFSRNNVGVWYLRFVYEGDTNYAGGISSSRTIRVNPFSISMETKLGNNGVVCVNEPGYYIKTTVKNEEDAPIANETIIWYLDSETEENKIGQSTTNSNGIADISMSRSPATTGTHTVITRHPQSSKYELQTVVTTMTVNKRTRELSVTSADSVLIENEYNMTGNLSYQYTTSGNNFSLTNHEVDITPTNQSITQQPIIEKDYISIEGISTTATNKTERSLVNGELFIGKGYTTYYQYPIHIYNGTNETHIYELQNQGQYAKIVILRLNDDGTYMDSYDYSITSNTYGNNPLIKVQFNETNLNITELKTGKTIVARTLTGSGSNIQDTTTYKRYIGFYDTTTTAKIVKHKSSREPLAYHPILDLNYWTYRTNPAVDPSTQEVAEPYITDNDYVYPGIRKQIYYSARSLSPGADTYIQLKTYQKKNGMYFGFVRFSNDDWIVFNQLLPSSINTSDWAVHTWEIKINNDGSADFYADGTLVNSRTNDYRPYILYVYCYNLQPSTYIQSIVIRQDTLKVLTTNSAWGCSIIPYGDGTYHFDIIAPVGVTNVSANDWIEVSTEKTLYVGEKVIPTITLSNKTVKKGTNSTLTVTVPNNATGTFNINVYNKNGSKTVLAENLTQNNGQISYTSNYNTYNKGVYTYEIEYSGDNTYNPITSPKKTLTILDNFTITNEQSVGSTITAQTKTTLSLSGNVTDTNGENYTGNIEVHINNTKVKDIPCTGGMYGEANNTVDLSNYTPNTYSLKLICKDTTNNITTTLSLSLVITKKNTTIEAKDSGIMVNTNQAPGFDCTVPSDFTGEVRVYAVNNNNTAITGNWDTSLISKHTLEGQTPTVTTSNGKTRIRWWAWSNTTTANNMKITTGAYKIKYILTNDTNYLDSETYKMFYTRQMAQIITEETIRQWEHENTVINIRAYDTLGQAMNGTLKVTIDDNTTETVTINNGVGQYTLGSGKRQWKRNTEHITNTNFEYEFATSGYWTKANGNTSTKTYNIPAGKVGLFVNSTPEVTLSMIQTWKNKGITDLYIRANQEEGTLGYLHGFNIVMNLLKNNNLRSYFRVHAVFGCVSNGSGTWYTVTGSDGLPHIDMTRIADLQQHINTLLSKDIDGICFDYIRRGSSATSAFNEEEVSTLLTSLTEYIKQKTPQKTIIISACVTPEYSVANTTYGQNYKTFEDNVDYIIPMIYPFSFNKTLDYTTTTNSEAYMWMQNVLYHIYTTAQNNKLIPVIQTYYGDGHENETLDHEHYLYQTIGLWNHGVERNYTQQSVIYFRNGLLGTEYPGATELTTSTADVDKIEIVPILYKTTLNKETDKIKIAFRTKWGQYLGTIGNGIIKINGTTYKNTDGTNYTYTVGRNDVTIPIDFSSYTSKEYTIELVYGGSNQYHVKEMRYTTQITLR